MTTSSIVSSLGAGSGIDVTSLVEQLVEVERSAPQSRIDTKKETLEAQISAYGTLKSSLSTLQSSISSLTNSDVFNSRSASVPDTDMFVANSLDANAQTGTFQIGVEALAQAQTLVAANTFESKDASLNMSGNLTIRFGEWSYDETTDDPTGFTENIDKNSLNIEIDSDDTLQDVADKINEAGNGIQASVLKVDGSYQLMINAEAGGKNALEITSDDASLASFNYSLGDMANMTETLKGQSAEVKINGLSVFRDSNEIDDVIEGLDFSLSKASPGETVAFTISEDRDTAEEEIRNFVDAYNTFYESAKTLMGVATDSETEETTAGTLSSDGTAKALLAQVRSLMTSAVGGVDDFNALTNLGIRTQLDGTLEIVEDDFSAAMSDNYEKVAAIFSPQTSASTSGLTVGMGSYSGEAVPGTYDVEITTPPSKGTVVSDAAFAAFSTDESSDYTFKVSVDGTSTETLTLSGTFNTADELANAISSLINNDENLKSINTGVEVSVDESGVITFNSKEYGASSKVKFSAAGDAFASATGFSTTSTSTAGKDVVGTINGESAFGSGNILLPSVGTDAYGLNLTIEEGVTGSHTFSFSRGLASELTMLVDNFLDDSSGIIAMREDNMNTQLDNLDDDQDNLDRRITMYEERLTAQFTAMEAIIASFQSTGDSVASLFDTLPYTSSNN